MKRRTRKQPDRITVDFDASLWLEDIIPNLVRLKRLRSARQGAVSPRRRLDYFAEAVPAG